MCGRPLARPIICIFSTDTEGIIRRHVVCSLVGPLNCQHPVNIQVADATNTVVSAGIVVPVVVNIAGLTTNQRHSADARDAAENAGIEVPAAIIAGHRCGGQVIKSVARVAKDPPARVGAERAVCESVATPSISIVRQAASLPTRLAIVFNDGIFIVFS